MLSRTLGVMQVRARSVVWTSLVVASCLALLACRSSTSVARENFGKKHSCPDDRITVTAHPELTWNALVRSPATPPADVAADPGRLAKWQADHAPVDPGFDIYEASGCDHREYYGCEMGYVERSGQHSSERVCHQAPTPP